METLLEIERIKTLKSRYFRLLDCKLWNEWKECFSEDFTAVYEGPHPDIEFGSRDVLVEQLRQQLGDIFTVHQGHTPEIIITGEDTATGIWAMYDRVELAGAAFEGWGHYHEEYRKVEGDWKISRLRLTRLKVATLDIDQSHLEETL